MIDRLIIVGKCWPQSIHTLIIADNEINDLTEVSQQENVDSRMTIDKMFSI
jgi:hypothetical protein